MTPAGGGALVSGGSPGLGVYGPPDLGFRRELHLRHGCDLENLTCSPWEVVSSCSSLTAELLTGGGESSSCGIVLLALWLGFVGKIR
jgi:hypothetical protein